MLSWSQAHQLAHMEAVRAHAQLHARPESGRVEVFEAICHAGVILIWRPLPTVFGAYVNEAGGQPGILLNSGLSPAVRRYTGGHELGHHRCQHSTSIDDGSTISITSPDDQLDAIPAASTARVWTDQEKLAEAFAAWFLMPRVAVKRALQVLGLERPGTPTDVYRLSLLLGVPYRSLVRHLPNLRLANPVETHRWGAVPPSRIKAGLDSGFERPTSRAGDVWQITAGFDGATVEVTPGDRLVLPIAEFDPGQWLTSVPVRSEDRDGQRCLEVSVASSDDPATVSVFSPDGGWRITVHQGPRPSGLDRGSR